MKYLKRLLTILVLVGFVSAGGYLLWSYLYPEPKAVSAPIPALTTEQREQPIISGTPKHIDIPTRNVSLEIMPGYYDTLSSEWTVSKDKAHFATVTSQPNNKQGNTFIYGHNRSEVFTRLLDMELGETATITTDNNRTFTYVLTGIHDTSPEDVSYLQPTEKPTLTVQTCSGPLYQYRRMLTFSFKEVV